MNNLELLNIGPLKCDADGCDYTQEVPNDELKEWINKSCPKCGANLLTYDDFERFKVSLDAMTLINSMSEDQINELGDVILKESGCADMQEFLQQQNIIKDKEGLKNLERDGDVTFAVGTHKELHITDIKKAE
jgi:hypothetical protein